MTSKQAWKRLGLAPTDDEKAIRRAYATELRALDVDNDPAGFEKLREARDKALWAVRDKRYAEQLDDQNGADVTAEGLSERQDAGGPPAPVEPQPETGEIPFAVTDAWQPGAYLAHALPWTVLQHQTTKGAAEDPYSEHASALSELLIAEPPDVPLTDADAAAAQHHLTALLSDPRLEQVDRRAEATEWIAMTLADAIPRSDPLLTVAADALNWSDRAGRIDEDWWVQQINQRIAGIAFRGQLVAGHHPLSRAWRELTRSTAPGKQPRRNLFVRAKRVEELLTAIRAHYPSLEAELVEARVQLWEQKLAVKGGTRTIVLVVIFTQVVLAVARCDSTDADDKATAPTERSAPAP